MDVSSLGSIEENPRFFDSGHGSGRTGLLLFRFRETAKGRRPTFEIVRVAKQPEFEGYLFILSFRDSCNDIVADQSAPGRQDPGETRPGENLTIFKKYPIFLPNEDRVAEGRQFGGAWSLDWGMRAKPILHRRPYKISI